MSADKARHALHTHQMVAEAGRALRIYEAIVRSMSVSAWAFIAYRKGDEVRHLWNATPHEAPELLQLCDQGWVWRRDNADMYPAEFYVPPTGSTILMFDGGRRIVPVRVDRTLADAFAGRRERRALDQIILAPRKKPAAATA